MKKQEGSYLSLLAAAGSIGMNFAITLVVGLLIGRAVDEWARFSTMGDRESERLLGFITGMWSVAKLVMKGKDAK